MAAMLSCGCNSLLQPQFPSQLQFPLRLGLSRGRLVRGYPSKNTGAGIPDLVPDPVLVPAKAARKESNAAFKFPARPGPSRG